MVENGRISPMMDSFVSPHGQMNCWIYIEISVWYIVIMIVFQVPLFQNTEVGFQKMLAMCIKPVYYLAKEYIVRKYDFGKEVSVKWS